MPTLPLFAAILFVTAVGVAYAGGSGPPIEGPPGHAHGGSMAAVLDEAMGAAAWMEGHLVVAVRLATSF